jgi:hypothetical protein
MNQWMYKICLKIVAEYVPEILRRLISPSDTLSIFIFIWLPAQNVLKNFLLSTIEQFISCFGVDRVLLYNHLL